MATTQWERFNQEITVQVSAKRMWCGLVSDAHNCLPRCMPDKIEKIQYEAGNRAQVGCIRVTSFHKGHHRFVQIKEKFEEIDEQNLKVKLHVIEGGFLGIFFNNYKIAFQFTEGCVRWSLDYHAKTHHRQVPDEVKELIVNTIKAVEAYLLANTTLYC